MSVQGGEMSVWGWEALMQRVPLAAALLNVGGSTKAEGEGGVFGGYISV